jgi:hypothetical protein
MGRLRHWHASCMVRTVLHKRHGRHLATVGCKPRILRNLPEFSSDILVQHRLNGRSDKKR